MSDKARMLPDAVADLVRRGAVPSHEDRAGNPSVIAIAALLLVVALATRLQFLGNPLLDSDEAFYLLVGDRMTHGAIPYVDIWDRKPVGLFLIYAAMSALGGVLAYQLLGTLVATGTAFLIFRLARRHAGAFGAAAAAIAYLVWLPLGAAAGGQAELLYAFPIAMAATITLRGWLNPCEAAAWRRGTIAMLLVGMAMQIKYNALFEGVFFGLAWIAVAWRAGRRLALLPLGLLWVGAALMPTIAALAWYAAIGRIAPFLYANFLSIWRRTPVDPHVLLVRLGIIAMPIVPLLACIRRAPASGASDAAAAYRFTLGWLAATILGLLAFGTYLEQYMLPILVPACVAAAPLLGRGPRWRPTALIVLFLILGQVKLWITQDAHGTRSQLSAILSQVDRRGCLFVYSGSAALYRLSGTCIPTRFAFPSHLSRQRDVQALGVDPVAEVDRVMRTHPRTVIVRSSFGDENWGARRVMFAYLTRDYAHVFHGALGWQFVDVYRARPS